MSKKVMVEIPIGTELVFEDGVYKIVDEEDLEYQKLLVDFNNDINALYDKYEERLRGKYSIHAEILFTSYRDGNRKKVSHWVDNINKIDLIKGEQNWHD